MHGMTEIRPVDLIISDSLVSYDAALEAMQARARAIFEGTARECVWFLEHAPLYTAGTSAKLEDLREPGRFPVHDAGRGGQYTYHGPGQRVAYVMLNVGERGRDVRAFVRNLEKWIVAALADLGVSGGPRDGRVGVWVARPDAADGEEDKIAAIGVRLRRWVSFHGISLNVSPDLEHFTGITPCGIADPLFGVTSLAALGQTTDMARVDEALKAAFEQVFESAMQRTASSDLVG
ncbi:UNVERIFIED_CONTAM: hypothetical protein GTU68_044595 [Idotea baltica]|nr:hypothetical protein [Idotea baltica]